MKKHRDKSGGLYSMEKSQGSHNTSSISSSHRYEEVKINNEELRQKGGPF